MKGKPYLIAPFESGLQKGLEPWLLPEDAFTRLNNAFIYRGRVRKRVGAKYTELSTYPLPPNNYNYQMYSRLRMKLGTTLANGNFSTPAVPGSIFKTGQMFSVGNVLFTVPEAGTPRNTIKN